MTFYYVLEYNKVIGGNNMNIVYHKQTQTFHLYNTKISYIMKVLKDGSLGQIYYGKAIKDRESFDHLLQVEHRDMAPCTFEGDSNFSLEHLKQEYPSYGHGDLRHPAVDILQSNGSRIVEFLYDSYQILPGKPKIKGLPACYVENNDEAMTLIITLKDELLSLYIDLHYTIYNNYPVICRHAEYRNMGDQVVLQSALSMNLDLPDDQYTMIELTGAWARERSINKRKLSPGIQSIYSMRGTSSSNFNPFIALQRENTTENSGEVYGFSLIYSGNFIASVEVDTYHVSRVALGIHPNCFNYELNHLETFETPEVAMVYSDEGLNGMSHAYHELYRNRLARGKYRNLPRPILINNWEGTYFDFNEQKILEMAKLSASLGIELFVLDDGWFGKRVNDHAGLGDWYPNLEKLPNGIAGLSRKIEALGMKFGLWFEPEMVNKDSDLYRAHPNWTLETPNRHSCHGRNQFILDYSNPEVVDYIYNLMNKIIQESKISYIKWDMNRCMSEVYSSVHSPNEQGKVMHQYILGVYSLYERLTSQYPDILFESCASGGARFDPGMLYYAPQGWTSDDTDAIERVKIQYGTSLVYPISSMGSHVSAVPNHQLHRNTPLATRANVAYFGTFGYELDVTKLDQKTLETMKKQIQFMKDHRELIQQGDFYRLKSPFENDETSWMVINKEKTKAIVGYYRPLNQVNVGYNKIKLTSLDPELVYTIDGVDHYGDELMNFGLIITRGSFDYDASLGSNDGDYYSRLYILEAK